MREREGEGERERERKRWPGKDGSTDAGNRERTKSTSSTADIARP